LGTEVGGVVLVADRDGQGDGLVAQRLDDPGEEIEVVVPDRSQRHVHDGPIAEGRQPLRRGCRGGGLGRGGAQRLHRGERGDLGILQRRRTGVHVQVLEEPGDRMRVEATCPPVPCRRVAGRTQQRPGDQSSVADIDVGHAARRTDQGRGQLGDLVDDEIRGPRVDDGVERGSAGLQLEVGEDLREEEQALLVADEALEAGKARRPLRPETLRRSDGERLETGPAGSPLIGLAGGERHHVTGLPGCGRQSHEWFVVTGQRPTREQHPGL
jgi:hypothetical protein